MRIAHAGRKAAAWTVAGAVLYASYLLILLTLPYLSFEKNTDFLLTKQLVYHIDSWRWSFYVHIFSSPVVILSGLVQLVPALLYRYPELHRILGRIYVITVLLVSGPAALVMSFYANGNAVTKLSFILLSCCWLTFTYIGYRRIRKGNIQQHTYFMTRSYALTLSAVTLRFYAYLLDVFGVSMHPADAYLLLSWTSWIPNLLVAETLIHRNKNGRGQLLRYRKRTD